MPQVIVIDEIGTELEAAAARTIAERGVQLIGTAHGNNLDNLMLNPTLSDLIGGIQSVTLGDEEARRRRSQKSVLERKAPPTFDVVVEIQSRERVTVHPEVADTVDALAARRSHRARAALARRRRRAPVSVATATGTPDAAARRALRLARRRRRRLAHRARLAAERPADGGLPPRHCRAAAARARLPPRLPAGSKRWLAARPIERTLGWLQRRSDRRMGGRSTTAAGVPSGGDSGPRSARARDASARAACP